MPIFSPILLQYYITYRCNCHCQFCDIWRLDSKKDADISTLKENLRQAKNLGVRFVDFTGGEPLLHPNLPQILTAAKNFGLRTSVTTNTILYPKRAQELTGKIDFLHFSLDATTSVSHDLLRGQTAFDQVMCSIDIARHLGDVPDLIYTVTPGTIKHLPGLAAFAKQAGLMLIVNPIFANVGQSNLKYKDLESIEKYINYPYVYINKAFHSLRRKGGNNVKKPRCRVVQSTIVISPDNKLVLPCFHHWHKQIQLQDNLQTVWSGQKTRYFLLQQGKLPHCSGCIINCYFDPSFCYKLDSLFFQSLWAKLIYSWDKYLRRKYQMFIGQLDQRSARAIMSDILT